MAVFRIEKTRDYTVMAIALLGVAVLLTCSLQNGIILLVMAFLISPFGLPTPVTISLCTRPVTGVPGFFDGILNKALHSLDVRRAKVI